MSFGKIWEYRNPPHSTVLPCSIILDLEDDIGELSSLSSYPSSPGTSSQILLDDRSHIPRVNLDDEDDEVSRFLSSGSPSPVPTPLPLRGRKRLIPRFSVWGKPEGPLGLLVEIRLVGTKAKIIDFFK